MSVCARFLACGVCVLFERRVGLNPVTDCSTLNSMTLEAAKAKAKLPGGGMILVVMDCFTTNYSPASDIGWGEVKAWGIRVSGEVRRMANSNGHHGLIDVARPHLPA